MIEIAFIASVKLHLLHGYDCIKFKQRSFWQLRTQALASLHGSLQNNQGIPVTHIMSWLGLEVNAIFDLFCQLAYFAYLFFYYFLIHRRRM